MTGGGADVFMWDMLDILLNANDTITDFDATEDLLDFSEVRYVGFNAPAAEDRIFLSEVNGGTMVSVDLSFLSGATETVFLEGVTGLTGSDW